MYLWGPQKLNPYYDVYIPVITVCLRLSTENIPVHFEWPSRSGYFGGSEFCWHCFRHELPCLYKVGHVFFMFAWNIWNAATCKDSPLQDCPWFILQHVIPSACHFAAMPRSYVYTHITQQIFDTRDPKQIWIWVLRSQSGVNYGL